MRPPSPVTAPADPSPPVMDVEKVLLSLMATSQSAPKKRVMKDEGIILEEAAKEKKAHAEVYARKRSVPKILGFSFRKAQRVFGQGLPDPELSATFQRGADSPGPDFVPLPFAAEGHRASRFSRALRLGQPKPIAPGPKYDLPGTLGRAVVGPASPMPAVGRAPRFPVTCRDSPPPTHYNPILPRGAPSFSFTSDTRGLKPGKLFLSECLAAHDGRGILSPGPVYAWSADLLKSPGPSYSFSRARSPTDTTAGSQSQSRSHSVPPGPGHYSPAPASGTHNGPAFSLGGKEHTTRRFLGRELVQPGFDSPGPQYNPTPRTQRDVSGPTFGAPRDPHDPESSHTATSELLGRASPGPAAYTVTPAEPSGPSYTMGRREKLLMKRISPGPERARYLSAALVKENVGTFSPGPKYKVPDGIGNPNSIRYTFGLSDRTYDDIAIELKEKLGTIEKPYTAPCEARYHSAALQAVQMRGKFSPGPKYNPSAASVTKRAPAFSFGGATARPRPTAEDPEDAPLPPPHPPPHPPVPTVAAPPSARRGPALRFGTGRRLLDDSRASQMVGRDSPGPAYHPTPLTHRPPGRSLGGLH